MWDRFRYWNGNEEGSAGYYSANYRLCSHHDWVCYYYNWLLKLLHRHVEINCFYTHFSPPQFQIHLPRSGSVQSMGRMGLFRWQLLLLYFPFVHWFRWFSSWCCCELTTQLDSDCDFFFFIFYRFFYCCWIECGGLYEMLVVWQDIDVEMKLKFCGKFSWRHWIVSRKCNLIQYEVRYNI